ncbi:hypothetical protein TNCV_3624931 [Trichonephila clavipes]|nr:hypothetical protein TNCV_3624931 [Trichonephila clavipes]
MQNNHKENKQFFKSDVNSLSKIQSFKYRSQQQYSQGKYPKVFTPSTAIKHNHQCLKIHVRKDYSQAQPSQSPVKTILTTRQLNQDSSPYRRASSFIGATETSRNITTRVIECDTSGDIYFLEDSRGF